MRIKQTIETNLFKRMDAAGNSWPVMMMREALGLSLLESNVQEFYQVHDCIQFKLNDIDEKLRDISMRLDVLEEKTKSLEAGINAFCEQSDAYMKDVDAEIKRQNRTAASWWR